jgi:hypothetical protein
MILISLALAAIAMSSLMLSYHSTQIAAAAERRATAAEYRSARNTILHCVQLDRQHEFVERTYGIELKPEPLCDPGEVKWLRDYVKAFK